MDRWLGLWMSVLMDGCMMENGWMEGGVNRGIKKWVENEWTDGWMDGLIYRWMNGWMGRESWKMVPCRS